MIVQLAFDHFFGGLHDDLAEVRIHLAEVHVRFGSGLFHDAQRADDGLGLLFPADLEVSEAALRLCAPIGVIRNFDWAHRVGFGPRRHGLESSCVEKLSRRV